MFSFLELEETTEITTLESERLLMVSKRATGEEANTASVVKEVLVSPYIYKLQDDMVRSF